MAQPPLTSSGMIYSMETSPPASEPGPPYPNEPAVLQRLPREVEYTFIKMILADVPGPSMTAAWTDREPGDEISKRFRNKTYGAVDRALQKVEAALRKLPPDEQAARQPQVRSLRHAWVQQVIGETGALGSGAMQIVTTWTDPQRMGISPAPTGLDGPGFVIEVLLIVRKRLYLVERWAVPATLMPWRPKPGVPWVDPELVNEIYAVLIRTYFRPILRKRVGQRWRTEREPAGWPILTQRVIPALYDYLRPYYPARSYRHHRQLRSDGHFPAALRRDITDLIKLECPHLAEALTPERVTAGIQRYLRRAPRDRRMGIDLFKPTLPSPEVPPDGKVPRK
jgi:hypothetical protein